MKVERNAWRLLLCLILISVAALAAHSQEPDQSAAKKAATSSEKSQAIVLLRGLPTLDTKHSVAIVELDPEGCRCKVTNAVSGKLPSCWATSLSSRETPEACPEPVSTTSPRWCDGQA